MSWTTEAKSAAKRFTRRHPRRAFRTAAVLRRLGRTSLATRIERSADLVVVAGPRSASRLAMKACDGQDQIARDIAKAGWGGFEDPLPIVIVGLARRYCPSGLFVDVGANTGFYALLVANACPNASIDAYEPYPPAYDLLRHNVRINGARQITTVASALGRDEGAATLYVPSPDHGLIETSASLSRDFAPERCAASISVDVRTLDRTYADGTPSMIKIDVESLEPDVIEGGLTCIERAQPMLVLEILPESVQAPLLESLRKKLGYVDIRLRPTTAIVGDEVRGDDLAWNHLWCPAHELRSVVAILSGVGLAIHHLTPN